MRINHNISALNTYRQMGANQSAASKNMEKLSSGLKINRAGDDAAGLAISEKMRGQIRGLDMASKNAQDGISLIQSGEGALNETHSILQRMRELAVQAGNDTNTTADRGEIQKEINQLTSEINRIGNTTEFNTQKLLDGNVSGAGSVAGTGALAGGAAAGPAVASTGTITAGTGAAGDKININGVEFELKVGGTNAALDEVATGATAKDTADNLITTFNAVKAANADLANITLTTDNNGVITVSDSSGSNTTTLSVTGAGATVSGATLAGGTAAGTATAAKGELQISKVPTVGDSLKIGDKIVDFYSGAAGAYAGANTGIDIDGLDAAGIAAAIAGGVTGGTVNVGINAGDPTKLDLTAATAGIAGNNLSTEFIAGPNTQAGLKLQIGANAGQFMTIGFEDMRSKALEVSADAQGATKAVKDGQGNNITAYYTATQTVTNGTSNANVEYALDISSADKATAAIAVLDESIASVSAERSKLGSFQNRLEHTINNLGTSSENLTAAESRIRDVDMAKEMMEMTKNNILQQAAQAMLAQANQQPQGVLQLLR